MYKKNWLTDKIDQVLAWNKAIQATASSDVDGYPPAIYDGIDHSLPSEERHRLMREREMLYRQIKRQVQEESGEEYHHRRFCCHDKLQ